MVINFCFAEYGVGNIAENFTQPSDYFDFQELVRKVPFFSDPEAVIDDQTGKILVGGGGIPNAAGWYQIMRIVECAPPTVPVIIWGMGINDSGRLDRNYDRTLDWLLARPNVLVGLRDVFATTHTPCASCMRPEFDRQYELAQDIVFYGHHSHRHLTLPYPTMFNAPEGNPAAYLETVLRFLASAEIVVTNTYHGAYWATLLARKVIVVAPFSNKFCGLVHEPIIASQPWLIHRVVHLARNHPNALADARALNRGFYNRVLSFFELHRERAFAG